MLKKVKLPFSQANKFPGKWLALSESNQIVAVGDSMEDISDLVTGTKKYPPKYASFKVPETELEWMLPLANLSQKK